MPPIDLPRLVRSKLLLMFSSGMVCVARVSMLILFSMYQSMIFDKAVSTSSSKPTRHVSIAVLVADGDAGS